MAGNFENFLGTYVPETNMFSFLLALILSLVLSYVLRILYIRYGTAVSNRKKFSENFLLLTLVVTFIITIIKSSLALSLGLVGALSIVRFRTAIKEPEELAFLFLSIGMGLGLGAGQIKLTLVFSIMTFLVIYLRHFYIKKNSNHNFILTVSGKLSNKINLSDISNLVKKHSNFSKITRFNKSEDNNLEVVFIIDLDSLEDLVSLKKSLLKLSSSLSISYLDAGDLI